MSKYALPTFLVGKVDQATYQRWLERKAQAHVRRDRKRGNATAIGDAYRVAIHAAVVASNGQDAYTGELLDWSLLSRYDNVESAEGGRRYKHGFQVADRRPCQRWSWARRLQDLRLAS